MLIGLNGKKGSGKDTAGSYLVEHHGFVRLSFAGPLKQSAAAALGVVIPDEVAAGDYWEQWKNNPDARLILSIDGIVERDISVREYLQFYGTEAHRDIFGKGFWTDQTLDTYEAFMEHQGGHVVITDARFVNECSAIRSAGGVILRIDRPGTDSTDTHASEEDLPAELVDGIVVNGGTIEDLHATLDTIVTTVCA